MSEPVRTDPRPPLFTRRFAALLVVQAGFGYAFSSFLLLPKFVVTALHGDAGDIGAIETVHGIACFLLMPWMGGVVDRAGRRDFLTAGALLMAVSAFAYAAVDTVGPLVFLLRALQGVAFAMSFSAGAALALDLAPPERLAQAIGFFGMTFLSMNAVAPTLVEQISLSHGWGAAFGTAGASATLCAVLSRFLRERRGSSDADGPVPSAWEFARRPRQIRTSIVIALAGAALGIVFRYYQPFAIELGSDRVRSFLIGYALAAVAARVLLGELVDRTGRRRVTLACLVSYVGVLLGMTQLTPGSLPWFGVWMGVTHGLFYPAFNAVAAEGASALERGKVMALFQASWQVGFSVVQAPLGQLAERLGYPAVFVAGALCALLALVVLSLSPEGKRAS